MPMLAWITLCTGMIGAPPSVRIERVNGQSIEGRLTSMDTMVVFESTSGTESLEWHDILTVNFRNTSSTTPAKTPAFELADGSLLRTKVVRAADRAFVVQVDGADMSVGFDAVRSIRGLSDSPAGLALFERSSRGKLTEDLAVVGRGNDAVELRGALAEIGPDQLVFEYRGKETVIPWSRLTGVMLARTPPRSASQVVWMADGQRFAGRVVSSDETGLVLVGGTLNRVKAPWDRILRIVARSERVRYLSDLSPIRYEMEPLFEKVWPYAMDQTLTGRELRLGGQAHAKGVVMHSRAALTFALAGEYDEFTADVGILDEVTAHSCADVRLLADGEVIWKHDGLCAGQPPKRVHVSVSGAVELTLLVDYGENLDVADHVAWAGARLLR